MDALPHIAFALVAISFAVRDILRLRCLAMVASAVAIAYELTQYRLGLDARAANALWHLFFMSINAYQIWALIYGERHTRFSDEERAVYEQTFRDLTRLEFRKLLDAAEWRDAEPGAVLTEENRPVADVMYIVRGQATVESGGHHKARLGAGQFLGEMSYVTGETASATVRVTEPLRYVAWPRPRLRALLRRRPSIRFTMSSVLGVDMSRKLRRSIGEA
ncbi:MAG: popeye domain-containing protein [Phycisphaerae bacterium]|nr:popeye domain-containing protein [Phycisphaerae bacterium]NNF44786.1 cyclic nucleotide-binding domain-containing protein [Phycisphaerales bacterium]